jgi:hypothetical protein
MKLLTSFVSLASAASVALAVSACNKQATNSDLAFASGQTHTQQWTTNYLNAAGDSSALSATSLSDLEQSYRSGAYQVIQWQEPSGAASTDAVRINSASVDTGLDSDLFLLDADGDLLAESATSNSTEQVGNLEVGDVVWPLQIFIGAYGPNGKVSQVKVTAQVVGSEATTESLDAEVAQMQTLCTEANGTFLSRSSGSRCECNGAVITYDTFASTYVIGGQPQSAAFINACVQGGGAVNKGGGSSTTSVDSVTAFRNACVANEGLGAVLSGTGTSSNCDCRGWTLYYIGFQSGYLAKGKTASDYLNDCGAALQ